MLVSVIIPTRNRARLLTGLIDAIASLNPVPFKWEVIVVDNASTDSTAEVVAKKIKTTPLTIRYLVEKKIGLHFGRHRGTQAALGKYLAYIDDDIVVSPSWIEAVYRLEQRQAYAVTGPIIPRWVGTPPPWLLELLRKEPQMGSYLSLLDLGPAPRPIDPLLVYGCNCWLPKQLVLDLKGFHPDSFPAELIHFRGDGETGLMKKFAAAGLKAYYDPAATVFHVIEPDRQTQEYLCRRAYYQGISSSFTQIRQEQGLYDPHRYPDHSDRLYRLLELFSFQEASRAIRRKFMRLKRKIAPSPFEALKRKLAVAHEEGRRFHQNQIEINPELAAHVKKPNYME